jgi:hypothetical protein
LEITADLWTGFRRRFHLQLQEPMTRIPVSVLVLVASVPFCSSLNFLSPTKPPLSSKAKLGAWPRGGAVLEASEASEAKVSQKQLDAAIDRAVATTTNDDIILQYDRRATWLWRQYHGTVLQGVWKACLFNMVIAFVCAYSVRFGGLGSVPHGTWCASTANLALSLITWPAISSYCCLPLSQANLHPP